MKIKAEAKFIEYLHRNIDYILVCFVIALSILIRFSVRFFENGDAINYLIPWYNQIKANGGLFGGLSQPIYSNYDDVCNYSFVYQFVLSLLTYLPMKPIYAIKLFSCIFDYLAMIEAVRIYRLIVPENNGLKSKILAAILILNPVVCMNSALWGQSDMIYTFWVLLALEFIIREKYSVAFIFYGIAFSFKLQAVFFLPFLLFFYFYKRKFSIINFVIIPVTMFVLNIPAFLQGRTIYDAISIYLGNTNMYKMISLGYPCFWNIINDGVKQESYYSMKYMAIGVTIAVLAIHMYIWIKLNVDLSSNNILYMAFLLCYTSVLFLPSMHERYGFLYEILALIVMIINKKTTPLYVALSILTMIMYGNALYSTEYNVEFMAVVNFLIYATYVYVIDKEMLKYNLKYKD